MSRRHTYGPKRGQCDNCPATKHLAMVEIAPGKKLTLCLECRQALRRIQKQQARKRAAAGGSGIVSAVAAGDDVMTEDLEAVGP